MPEESKKAAQMAAPTRQTAITTDTGFETMSERGRRPAGRRSGGEAPVSSGGVDHQSA